MNFLEAFLRLRVKTKPLARQRTRSPIGRGPYLSLQLRAVSPLASFILQGPSFGNSPTDLVRQMWLHTPLISVPSDRLHEVALALSSETGKCMGLKAVRVMGFGGAVSTLGEST